MDVSGVGTTADMVLAAPGPTERAPSEAARSAAANTTTAGATPTADTEQDTSVRTQRQEAEQERRAEEERQRERIRDKENVTLEGLNVADMFTLLGMRPVSPEEAARLEQAKAGSKAVTGDNGSFDLYA
jgi:hypothetical protein